MSVYSQISSNKQKTWLVMFLFTLFITTVAYVFGRANGAGLSFAGLALVISGMFSFASYYFSDRMVLSLSGAHEVMQKDDPELYHVVENLAIAAGLPKPKLYSINDNSLNAFATGRDPSHAVVCITAGLRSRLNKAELEGVIAHELSHIQNYDTRLMAVVSIMVGLVAILADFFMRSMWFGRGDRDNREGNGGNLFMILGIVFAIFSPIIATLIQLAISRRREFLADANAAYITRYPEGLARALEILAGDKQVGNFANNATAHLFIVDPFKGKDASSWLAGLFNTHPPLEERIKILRSM